MAEAPQGQESSNLGPAELLEVKCGPVFIGTLGDGQQSLVGTIVLCFGFETDGIISTLVGSHGCGSGKEGLSVL